MEPIEAALAYFFVTVARTAEQNECPLIVSCVYFIPSSEVINGTLMYGYMRFADGEELATDFMLNMESIYAELVKVMVTAAEMWLWEWEPPETIYGP